MEKKRLLLLMLVSILIIILATSFISADELTQVKKAYNWLQGKAIGKWATLDTKQHVFSLLALQSKLTQGQIDSSLRALLQKSQGNGTCWPSLSCNAVETAIAKIALDSLGRNSMNASEWLLNKSITPSLNLNWYLQLIQPSEATETKCLIAYDNAEHEIKIDKHGKLSGSPGNCFMITSPDPYWLSLQAACFNKTFNISCDQGIKANFLFKKANEWYVTSKTIDIAPLGVGSINLTTRCIAQGATCDYESTLWTAYSFMLDGREDIAKSFVPYLVMESSNNKKFVPESILFKITGKDSYADDIAKLQDAQGYIVPQGMSSAYNKYYDTALAKMTGAFYKANLTKTVAKLLLEQKQQGDWGCEAFGCDSSHIRETAMILHSFWPSYQWLSECEQQGAACVDNCSAIGGTVINYECFENQGECCNITYNCGARYGTCKASCSATLNETQVPYTCPSGVCCKNYSVSLCIGEIKGQICNASQECFYQNSIVPFIRSSDSNYCCKGTCLTASQTCQEQNGVDCDPSQAKTCTNNKWIVATDTNFCCQASYCIQGQQNCAQQYGIICQADETCKDGVLVVASDTQGQATCCIQGGECIKETCNYAKCESEETCVGGISYETADAQTCCEGGQCLATCRSQGGVPCNASMSCKGTVKKASDTTRCCIGKCQKKAAFPWWIIIVIAVIGVIALFFWLIKTGKIKLKTKPKPTMARIEYEFHPTGTPPKGLPPRGLPPRTVPRIQPRPLPTPTQKPVTAQRPLTKPPLQPQPKPSITQMPSLQKPVQKPSPTQPTVKKKLPPPPKPSA